MKEAKRRFFAQPQDEYGLGWASFPSLPRRFSAASASLR